MPAYEPKAIHAVYDAVKAKYPRLKFGGIYANKPGYHNSRAQNKPSDYSVQRADDKVGDKDAASALDLTLPPAAMKTLTQRLIDATVKGDPRIRVCREFFGTVDGKTVVGYDVRDKRKVTADDTHLWHIHVSFYRKFATDEAALQRVADVLLGKPAPAPAVKQPAPVKQPVKRVPPPPPVKKRPAKPKAVRVHVMHQSMQYSDTKAQQLEDADKLFARAKSRGVWWVTGTEANQPEDSANFKKGAEDHGYRYFHKGGDVWVAVDPLVASNFQSAFTMVIPGKAGSYPNRGVLRVSFSNVELGRINVLACHYNLSGPQHPHAPGAKQNPVLAAEIAKQAERYGQGSGLVFYGGDQNLRDEKPGVDTFYGKPLTSAWDELKHYEPTHAGAETIDVIASYNKDGRVKAAYIRALPDSKFKLNTDHFLVEAGFDVLPVKAKAV
jgi:hypothetical protein